MISAAVKRRRLAVPEPRGMAYMHRWGPRFPKSCLHEFYQVWQEGGLRKQECCKIRLHSGRECQEGAVLARTQFMGFTETPIGGLQGARRHTRVCCGGWPSPARVTKVYVPTDHPRGAHAARRLRRDPLHRLGPLKESRGTLRGRCTFIPKPDC